jgi:hypothetical protein
MRNAICKRRAHPKRIFVSSPDTRDSSFVEARGAPLDLRVQRPALREVVEGRHQRSTGAQAVHTVFFTVSFANRGPWAQELEEGGDRVSSPSVRRGLALLLCAAGGAVAAEDRTEVGVLPATNYSTDTGLGVGVVAALARLSPDLTPYRWRLQALVYLALKRPPEGGLETNEHDTYVDLDVPRVGGGPLRLRGYAGLQRLVNAGWYGVGNATRVDPEADRREYQVDRFLARVDAKARLRLATRFDLFSALRASVVTFDPYEGSLFERERAMLAGARDHGELLLTAGVLWDTRDDETAPERGGLLELAGRAGTGVGERFTYGGLTAHARGFAPIVARRLVVGAKVVADVLAGDPPFYELARSGGMWSSDATGGGGSIRGVPAQRYSGTRKLLGSLELRLHLVPFRLGRDWRMDGLLGEPPTQPSCRAERGEESGGCGQLRARLGNAAAQRRAGVGTRGVMTRQLAMTRLFRSVDTLADTASCEAAIEEVPDAEAHSPDRRPAAVRARRRGQVLAGRRRAGPVQAHRVPRRDRALRRRPEPHAPRGLHRVVLRRPREGGRAHGPRAGRARVPAAARRPRQPRDRCQLHALRRRRS